MDWTIELLIINKEQTRHFGNFTLYSDSPLPDRQLQRARTAGHLTPGEEEESWTLECLVYACGFCAFRILKNEQKHTVSTNNKPHEPPLTTTVMKLSPNVISKCYEDWY